MTKKCHENSGGYACVQYCIVMCAILHVVAYLLSVNLLQYMYTVFVLYVWHPHFPLKE